MENVDSWPHNMCSLDLQQTNQISVCLFALICWPLSTAGTQHGHHQQTFACMALIHRPLPQAAQEKAQPCGFWTGRQGQKRRETQASFIRHSQSLHGLNFQLETRKKAEGGMWDLAV